MSIPYITLSLTFVFAMEITETDKEKKVTKYPFRVQVLRKLPRHSIPAISNTSHSLNICAICKLD